MFAGTKGVGERYWYGWVNPAGPEQPCIERELIGEFVLCRLADGTPCLDEYLFANPSGIEAGMLGTGVQRRFRIGDVAFDRGNGLVYVLELFAEDARPVVHVWSVR